jgi:hypothetical protein
MSLPLAHRVISLQSQRFGRLQVEADIGNLHHTDHLISILFGTVKMSYLIRGEFNGRCKN